ncbi:MAG TPA: hypothetical protein VGG29_00890 [Caulobacteraceae bacterium]|jgi:hypothetical protein
MKGFAGKYSSVAALAIFALAAAGAARADTTAQSPAVRAAIGEARARAAYPSFASIPPLPKDVRPLKAWRQAVTTTEAEGARLQRQAAAEPWTLRDTDAWADTERGQAAAPRQITQPSQADSEAFAAAMRARATPPPRKR